MPSYFHSRFLLSLTLAWRSKNNLLEEIEAGIGVMETLLELTAYFYFHFYAYDHVHIYFHILFHSYSRYLRLFECQREIGGTEECFLHNAKIRTNHTPSAAGGRPHEGARTSD